MLIRIVHKNKVVEFYNVPGKIANLIESLLHTIESDDSEITSAEFENRKDNKE